MKKRLLVETCIAAFIIFIIYSLTKSENLCSAHDSISYINNIDHGEWFHPHHLLFNWFAGKWIFIFVKFNFNLDSVFLVEYLNILFGSLTLSIFYLILRTHLSMKPQLAIIGVSFPAFSFGFWFYSVTIEVYIIPVFFLLLSFYILTSDKLSIRNFILIGIIHGIAILFHQVHILFSAVVLFTVILKYHQKRRILLNYILSYFTVLTIIVSIPYLIIALGFLRIKSMPDLWYWLTTYMHDEKYWHTFNITTLVKAVIGFSNSFIGGHYVFAIPSFQSYIERFLSDKWLTDEFFLVKNMENVEAMFLLITTFLLILVLIIFISNIRTINTIRRKWRNMLGSLICWFLVYSIFFFFWDPSNLEFWIPQSLIIWLIFLSIMNPSEDKKGIYGNLFKLGLVFIAVSLFIVNYLGSIRWLADFRNDYYYMKTTAVSDFASKSDLTVIAESWILRGYIERFTSADVIAITDIYLKEQRDKQRTIDYMRNAIDKTISNGHRVFVMEDAVDLDKNVRQKYNSELEDTVNSLWRDFKQQWSFLQTETGKIYILSGS